MQKLKNFFLAVDYLEDVFIEDVQKKEGYEGYSKIEFLSQIHIQFQNDYNYFLQFHAAFEPLNFTANYTENFGGVGSESISV